MGNLACAGFAASTPNGGFGKAAMRQAIKGVEPLRAGSGGCETGGDGPEYPQNGLSTALDVVGSGFGRTGTTALNAALERLGFGACHHMHEIVVTPDQRVLGRLAGRACLARLAHAFPDAKVVYRIRPEEQWSASFGKTIDKLMARFHERPLPPHVPAIPAA
jgi:hypothetical protein